MCKNILQNAKAKIVLNSLFKGCFNFLDLSSDTLRKLEMYTEFKLDRSYCAELNHFGTKTLGQYKIITIEVSFSFLKFFEQRN